MTRDQLNIFDIGDTVYIETSSVKDRNLKGKQYELAKILSIHNDNIRIKTLLMKQAPPPGIHGTGFEWPCGEAIDTIETVLIEDIIRIRKMYV